MCDNSASPTSVVSDQQSTETDEFEVVSVTGSPLADTGSPLASGDPPSSTSQTVAGPHLKLPSPDDLSKLVSDISECMSDSVVSEHHSDTSRLSPEQKLSDVTTRVPEVSAAGSNSRGQLVSDGVGCYSGVSAGTTRVEAAATRRFDRVQYLGVVCVEDPRSESEVLRLIDELSDNSDTDNVSVTVPTSPSGSVLLDSECDRLGEGDDRRPADAVRIFSCPIRQIVFCAIGGEEAVYRRCIGFTCRHLDSNSHEFDCHVLQCHDAASANEMLESFAAAFMRSPHKSGPSHSTPPPTSDPALVSDRLHQEFLVSLELLEEDGKGGFSCVPCDKAGFKLRCDTQRRVSVLVRHSPIAHSANPAEPHLTANTAVTDTRPAQLTIERCFGLLVAPGRNVKHGDMTLLEMMSMGSNGEDETGSYSALAVWDASDPSLQLFNHETPKDLPLLMSVGIDLIISGIHEPVRFIMECRVRIFLHSERFWYFSSKKLTNRFIMTLEKEDSGKFHIHSMVNTGHVEPARHSLLNLTLPTLSGSTSLASALYGRASLSLSDAPAPVSYTPDEDSDSDEPLPSGSGEVSKDCDVTELERWGDVLVKWRRNQQQRPRGLNGLVKLGVPEALRGEVWQLLVGCYDNTEMVDSYKLLIAKECSWESIIERDISRTFTGHEHFREEGGFGQDALFKLSKAYAVYDSEVGYCQGLSFLEAALLLHMPEEQAFSVLVHVMFKYRLRELFKDGFLELQQCFYQLNRLIEDQMPDLWSHLTSLGIESHMFASQWFLTVYTAKFPLFLVFHILDVFFLKDIDWVFQVALALLQLSRKELLAMDFDGVFKYFRVSMPKRYRTSEQSRLLMNTALAIKVKKLAKYTKEYETIKEQERLREDPVERLQRENRRLMSANLRLENESDELAMQLVSGRVNMRHKLDQSEEQCEKLTQEVLSLGNKLRDIEDERNRLCTETVQVKELLKKEAKQNDEEEHKNSKIIAEYQKICSQLSERIENERQSAADSLKMCQSVITQCDKCSVVYADSVARCSEEKQAFWHSLSDLAAPEDPLLSRDRCIRELELQLAQTKLEQVEVECRNQDLSHKLKNALQELAESRNSWLQKTLVSIKEVTKKDGSS